ncbi:hypothetical protein GEMRC1_008500 [Eukaryota sp. GEM-RC1]
MISRNGACPSTSLELPRSTLELRFFRGSRPVFNPLYPPSGTKKTNAFDLTVPFSPYTMSDHLYGNASRSDYIAGQVEFYFSDAYYPLYPQLQQEAATNRGFVPYNTILNRPRMMNYAKKLQSEGKPPITANEIAKCLNKSPHVICHKTLGIKPVNANFGPVEDIKRTFISVFPLTSGAEVTRIFEHLRQQNFRVTSFSGIFLKGYHMANFKLATETEALRIVNKSVLRIGPKQYLVIPKFTEMGDHNSVDSETECSVCYGGMTHSECSIPITSKCKHSRLVCNSCITRWIDQKVIVLNAIEPIKCPHANCDEILHSNDVQRFASSTAIYQDFEKGLTVQYLNSQPTFRWCAHQDCGNGFFINSADDRKVRCNHCRHDMCAHDKVPWHVGQTCEQWRDHDDSSVSFIRNNTSPCPSCNSPTVKEGGCLHLHCLSCGHDYWWCCGAPYQPRAARKGHAGNCRNDSYFPIVSN